MTDWSIGTYERIAAAIEPAAAAVIAAAVPQPGERVLDVGCGTGNAAALAVATGARVTGVDLAERLLAVARARVPAATFVAGNAAALPLADDAFDLAVSVFGVIFAQSGEAAAAELARVVRPGGRIVLSAWLPEGPIFEAGKLMRAATAPSAPASPPAPPVAWHDPAALEPLFGRPVAVERHTLPFVAASPEAWWDEQVAHHPLWIAGGEEIVALREPALEILRAGNADPGALRLESSYVVVTVAL